MRGSDVLDLCDQPGNRRVTMETGTALSPVSSGQNHLALICGLPSSRTYFVADLCRDLLVRLHGACEVVHINDMGQDTIERVAAVSGPALLLSEIPDADVIAMASEADFPIVIADQSFIAANYDFMGARGANFLDTVRTMARSQMGIAGMADIPRAILLDVEENEPASLIAEQIAAALEVSPEAWRDMVEIRQLARSLPQVLAEIFPHKPAPVSEEMDDVLYKLDRFYGLRRERLSGAWEVPLEVLLEGTPPHLPATDTIELVGPARCLTLGPYLYLPPGRWLLRFAFTTSDNASSNALGFDVTADEEVKFAEDYTITTAGRFEFQCDFRIENAFYPFEFRTFLRRGAIGGQFNPTSLVIEAA